MSCQRLCFPAMSVNNKVTVPLGKDIGFSCGYKVSTTGVFAVENAVPSCDNETFHRHDPGFHGHLSAYIARLSDQTPRRKNGARVSLRVSLANGLKPSPIAVSKTIPSQIRDDSCLQPSYRRLGEGKFPLLLTCTAIWLQARV